MKRNKTFGQNCFTLSTIVNAQLSGNILADQTFQYESMYATFCLQNSTCVAYFYLPSLLLCRAFLTFSMSYQLSKLGLNSAIKNSHSSTHVLIIVWIFNRNWWFKEIVILIPAIKKFWLFFGVKKNLDVYIFFSVRRLRKSNTFRHILQLYTSAKPITTTSTTKTTQAVFSTSMYWL